MLIVDRKPEVDLGDGLEIFIYQRSEDIASLFELASKHMDHEFRHGFWIHTFERLFALDKFHHSNPDCKLIHIESDVILMPNFPWDKFQNLNKLAWLNVNNENDIAALIYLDSIEHTAALSNFLTRTLSRNPKTTDMFAMREFALSNSEIHTYLPSITKGTKRKELKEFALPGEHDPNSFDGIFDPLAVGIWFFGQDPKNSYGFAIRYVDQSHHFIDASGIKAVYDQGVLRDQVGNNIYSLHIHAKNKVLFGQNWDFALNEFLKEAENKENSRYFEIEAFKFAISERTLFQHLWHYLSTNKRLYDLVHKGSVSSITAFVKRLLRI